MMKKSEVKKILNKLSRVFDRDDEALQWIHALSLKVNELPDLKSEDSDRDLFEVNLESDSLEIPKELKEAGSGYALFADGACRGNPGPGAYALLIQNEKGEVVLKSSGVEMPTTNNKMELQGVIRGLHGLYEKFQEDGFSQTDLPVFVYSDSKYVIDGINSWVPGWKSRGWKKADNKTPENCEFWKELDQLQSGFQRIKFIWVKGHAGHPQNEYCDKLANRALDEAGF